MEMNVEEELEMGMSSISPPRQSLQRTLAAAAAAPPTFRRPNISMSSSSTSTVQEDSEVYVRPPVQSTVPPPEQLIFLVQEATGSLPTEPTATGPETHSSLETSTVTSQSPLQPPSRRRPESQPSPSASSCRPPQLPGYDHDTTQWSCSHFQKVWMKTELESLGLWPGSPPVSNPMTMVSLWRFPPQPELIDSISRFPSPKYFQLHPFFIWKPENNIKARLRNNYALPCFKGCLQPQVATAGVGRPRVIVGLTGQYYLFSSKLCCKVCGRKWFADNPQWLEKLPKRFTNMLPAILTYKKAICKSVMDELRRTGNSPTDMANQINEMMHLKYERANLAYLLSCQNIMDGESGRYGQQTITQFIQQEGEPTPFGDYTGSEGWNGISVSAHYLTDCLLNEYQHQEGAINRLLQGTFGQTLRSDHNHKVARKVTFSSGAMSSYAVMNEHWMIISWVMVQSETQSSLWPMYEGLSYRYNAAGIEKAQYHWVDKDCCAAFTVAECIPGEHLQWEAWRTSDVITAEATSGNLLVVCASRTNYNTGITIKLDLFSCMRRFLRECVSEHHALYGSFAQFLSTAFSVVDQEDLQRLKDAYTFCGIRPANPTKQHIRKHCRTRIPRPDELIQRVEAVFKHFHLAEDPNGTRLFKPSMLKVWRIQRVHILRGCLSDPEVEGGILYRHGGTLQLNHVPGEGAKVPVWIPIRGTSQQEGYHYHQAQWVTGTRVSPELFQAQGMTGVARWNYQRLVDLKQPGVSLPAAFDPSLIVDLNAASRHVFGTVKYPALHLCGRDTGERFGLEYVEPGTRPVPLQWDKHRTKTDSTPAPSPPTQSCLPVTQEDLQPPPIASPPIDRADETPVAAYEPHTGQESTFSTPPPLLSSPTAAHTGPVKTRGRVFVLDHRRWPAPMRKVIDDLLDKHHGQKEMLRLVDQEYAALFHNSRTDPNSFLHPTTKIHISQYVKHLSNLTTTSSSLNTSVSETTAVPIVTLPTINPSALVQPPAAISLTQEAIERIVINIMEKQQQQQQEQKKTQTKRVEEKGQRKRRRAEPEPPSTGRKCGFCRKQLKQGPNSPHIHTGFPGIAGKYIYCPAKVVSLFKDKGMERQMTWREFQASPFYNMERERWAVEKGRRNL